MSIDAVLFDMVMTKDDVTNPKPAGEPYLLALKTIKVAAKNAIAIENTFTGVTAAKNAVLAIVSLLPTSTPSSTTSVKQHSKCIT